MRVIVDGVKYLQEYTFVLKHKAGAKNRVADALSRRMMMLSTMRVEVVGLEKLKETYADCLDFGLRSLTLSNTVHLEIILILCFKRVIYSVVASCASHEPLFVIFLCGNCTPEVWLAILAEIKLSRL